MQIILFLLLAFSIIFTPCYASEAANLMDLPNEIIALIAHKLVEPNAQSHKERFGGLVAFLSVNRRLNIIKESQAIKDFQDDIEMIILQKVIDKYNNDYIERIQKTSSYLKTTITPKMTALHKAIIVADHNFY